MEPFTFHASLPRLELGDTLLLGVRIEHQVISVENNSGHWSTCPGWHAQPIPRPPGSLRPTIEPSLVHDRRLSQGRRRQSRVVSYLGSEMCIGRDSPLEPFVLPAPGLPDLTRLTLAPTCANPEAEASMGQFACVWLGGHVLRGGATRSVVYFRCHTVQISERNCDQIIRLVIDSYRITSHEVANRLHHEAISQWIYV